MTRLLWLLPVALPLTGCIGIDFSPGDAFHEDFHLSYDLQPDGVVSVRSHNGSVEIAGWDQNKVEIDGEKYAGTERDLRAIRIDRHNAPSRVEIEATQGGDWFAHSGVRFRMHVPNHALIEATTSNGRIAAHDLSGGARLTTSNGRIQGDHIAGKTDAQTSNGSIEISGLDAEARAVSHNGPIKLAFLRSPAAGIHAETSNGSITLRLPAGTNARIEASTSHSAIKTDFEIRGSARGERRRLSGDIGNGGPLIELTTRNGAVSILEN